MEYIIKNVGDLLSPNSSIKRHELKFIKDRTRTEFNKYKKLDSNQIYNIIFDSYKDIITLRSNKMESYQNYDNDNKNEVINIREILIDEIYDVNNNDTNNNEIGEINSILGYNKNNIRELFNPISLYKKAYILLDTRYVLTDDATNIYKWNFINIPNDISGAISISQPIHNIIQFKMYEIYMPYTSYDTTFYNAAQRIFSFYIEEIPQYMYSQADDIKFQFTGCIDNKTTDSIISNGKKFISNRKKLRAAFSYDGANGRNNYYNDGIFSLQNPIKTLNTITLSVYNNYEVYNIPKCKYDITFDNGEVKISSATITGLPYYPTGTYNIVYISNFTTSDTSADGKIIEFVNRSKGHLWTVDGSNPGQHLLLGNYPDEVAQSYDWTDLTGTPVLTATAEFECFRITIPFEITYMSY